MLLSPFAFIDIPFYHYWFFCRRVRVICLFLSMSRFLFSTGISSSFVYISNFSLFICLPRYSFIRAFVDP